MNNIALKYNLLDSPSKKEVLAFMDFLINRKTKSAKSKMSDYKKKILKVSRWSESDIKAFTDH